MNLTRLHSAIPLAFILIILLGNFTFLLNVRKSEANPEPATASSESGVGWLTGWSNRKEHVIEGSTSGAQVDYQTKIIAHLGLGTDYNDNAKAPPEGHVYLGELSEDASQWEIIVDSTIQQNYGLTYPLTYVFNIASESTSPKVYYRFLPGQNWTQLPEKTENDFFNGINAVRFDHPNSKGYVSIAFSDLSDKIYLNFTDNYDKPIKTEFVKTAEYYDNRKAVVISTADDWSPTYTDYFKNACEAFRTRSIWLTAAIIPISAPWNDIQTELDAGYIEPASHSYDHPDVVPYLDYDLEIGTSKQQIIERLTLPTSNRKGLTEYVWAWIEPSGTSDETSRSSLGKYMYLCDRDITVMDTFAGWDPTNQLYQKIGASIWGDQNITTGELNSKFDQVYNGNGIYHLMFHPSNMNLTVLLPHLDYIKQRKDVWYAGFGHLYLYHFAQERKLVSVSLLGKHTARTDFGDVRFTDSDGTTLLDYWMEDVVGDYAVFWVKVPNIPANPNNATICIYYGRADATTTSDGDKTFLFFDHFEGSSLDILKWRAFGSVNYSIESSHLTVADVDVWGDFEARGYAPLQDGFAIECVNVYYAGVEDGAIEFLGCLSGDTWPPTIYAGYGDYWKDSQSTAVYPIKIDSTVYPTSWNEVPSPSTHDFEIRKDQNNNTCICLDGKLVLGPVVSSTPFSGFLFNLWKPPGFNCSKIAVDAVIIRKYCNPEPLHGNWQTTPKQINYIFSIVSNSTISALAFNSTNLELSFTVTGPSGTTGFAEVTMKKTLAANITDLKVYLDEKPLEYSTASTEDSWTISFDYTHSTHQVRVVLYLNVTPRISTPDLAIVVTVITTVAIAVKIRRKAKIKFRQNAPLGLSWHARETV
jgi:hypothetical protein